MTRTSTVVVGTFGAAGDGVQRRGERLGFGHASRYRGAYADLRDDDAERRLDGRDGLDEPVVGKPRRARKHGDLDVVAAPGRDDLPRGHDVPSIEHGRREETVDLGPEPAEADLIDESRAPAPS